MGPIARLLSLALSIYGNILLLYVVLSWVQLIREQSRRSTFRASWKYDSNPARNTGEKIYYAVLNITERLVYPVIHPLRRFLSPYQQNFPLDLSVLAAFVIIYIIRASILPWLPF